MWWMTKQITVKAYKITNVTEMLDYGGRDLTIEMDDGTEQLRHADQRALALYEPIIGDYWVQYDTVAMPWNKAEFEKRHTQIDYRFENCEISPNYQSGR